MKVLKIQEVLFLFPSVLKLRRWIAKKIVVISIKGGIYTRTLVVEDDFVSRELLQAFLAPYGIVNFAVDGREAVEAVKFTWGAGEPYDLICLDIMLPQMDGYQVLKEIRRLEEERKVAESERIKIIMTTALSDPRLVQRAYNEKCEGYLIKPINKSKLLKAISELGLI